MVCVSFDFSWFWVQIRTFKNGHFEEQERKLQQLEEELQTRELSLKKQQEAVDRRLEILDNKTWYHSDRFETILERQSEELDKLVAKLELDTGYTPASSVAELDSPAESVPTEEHPHKSMFESEVLRIGKLLQTIPHKSAHALLLYICAEKICQIHDDPCCLCWIERFRRQEVFQRQKARGIIVTNDSKLVRLPDHPPTLEFGTLWPWDDEKRPFPTKQMITSVPFSTRISLAAAEEVAIRKKLSHFNLRPELCFEMFLNNALRLPVYRNQQEFWEDFEYNYWSWLRTNMAERIDHREDRMEKLRQRIKT